MKKEILTVFVVTATSLAGWLALDFCQVQHAKILVSERNLTNTTMAQSKVPAREIVDALRHEMTQMLLYERYRDLKRTVFLCWLLALLFVIKKPGARERP